MSIVGVQRKKTRTIHLKNISLGSDHPIAIQSMTTTKTADVEATIKQVNQLADAGADVVRVTVNKIESAQALPQILSQVTVPIIADIHFDYKMALEALKYDIACVRINPGNIGKDWKVQEIIKAAQDKEKTAIRIGVNSGSLEKDLRKKYGSPTPEALVESALRSIDLFESEGFTQFKLSIKSSEVFTNYLAYLKLSEQTDAPLHVGLTEAGTRDYGIVKSSVGIGSLLLQGIGDTIRYSLSCDPIEEVKAGIHLLKSLGLRNETPEIISCPSCGRADIDVYRLAQEVETRALKMKKNIKIAVMGCVVNGPGESMDADIGIAGGIGEGLIYKKGKPIKKVPESEMLDFLMKEIELM